MKKLETLKISSINPDGWMREILTRYADGLLGSLEEVWPDVGPDNAWLGGNGDAWERGPYYVDGLVPMAFLLKDEKLLKKAQKWIEWSLSSQNEEGNFGPSSNDDWWPRFVMLKVITAYADGTDNDEFYSRVERFLDKYFDYFSKNISIVPLSMWAYVRGGEFLASILWLYERKKNEKYIELGKKVLEVSMDWKSFFSSMPFTLTTDHYLPWHEFQQYLERFNKSYKEPMKARRDKDPFFRIFHQTHGVNIAMGLKYLAYEYAITGNEELKDTLKSGYDLLMKYHGQVTGVFSSDEHINGRDPEKGTELCAVVELMYSIESIILITGDFSWMDVLEKLCFNALVATISEDGCAHQYDQQVNQTSCTIDKRGWYNNLDDSNIFGLEPNFGCCTANMHQGLPKYNLIQWLYDGCSWILTTYNSGKFSLAPLISAEIESDYPFAESIRIKIDSKCNKDFSLFCRIPSWCKSPRFGCEGKAEDNLICYIISKGVTELALEFPMPLEMIEDREGVYLKRGPILFSLPIEKKVSIIKDRGRFSDREYRPLSSWDYRMLDLSSSSPELSFPERILLNKNIDNSIVLSLDAIDSSSERKRIRLIPYGNTDLRFTVFRKFIEEVLS